MSLDRSLITTIKQDFGHRSTAQLEDLLKSNDRARWSPEAFEAAREVLAERSEGRADEPAKAKEWESTPAESLDPLSLAFLVALVRVAPLPGLLFRPMFKFGEPYNSDVPIAFGSKIAWLAVDTTDTEAVAKTLEIQDAQPAGWSEGIDAAHRTSVFITPPVGEWTLAVGMRLFPPGRADLFVKPLLERLSSQFGDAQYFCSHLDFETHVWARACDGRLLRGFGWRGEKQLTLWDEGPRTDEERNLDFKTPSEDVVMQLASLWSIDPTSLNEQYMEPVTGIVGRVPWEDHRVSAGADHDPISTFRPPERQ